MPVQDKGDFIIEWELQCRRLMGEKKYKKNRAERYEALISEMTKEKENVSEKNNINEIA